MCGGRSIKIQDKKYNYINMEYKVDTVQIIMDATKYNFSAVHPRVTPNKIQIFIKLI